MKKIIILLSIILPAAVYSQAYIRKAEKHYKNYNYPKVIDKLEDRDKLPTDAQRQLAESYKYLYDYANAEAAYAKVVAAPDKTPKDVYEYAQMLKMNGKYTEAQAQMKTYAGLNPGDSRVTLFNKNTNYSEDLLRDKGQFTIRHLAMNSEEQEFGAVYYKDKVVYTSSKHKIGPTYYSWNANKLHFLDIYEGKPNDIGEILDPKPMKNLNRKYHEGAVTFSKDGNTMFYTSDNYEKRSSDGIMNLGIHEAKWRNGSWHDTIAFPLDNKEYSVLQPALSPDGNTLYFSSDMPGGKGGYDLYKISRKTDGSWGTAENLGDKINTEGNEVFPYFHEKDILLFASDGRPGLGGLDVFATKVSNRNYSKVINAGAPINSNRDDFTFVLDSAMKKGYFASNRAGGSGSDDIYSFNMLKPFVFGKTIKGTAKDLEGNILAGVEVKLLDDKGAELRTVTTKEDGAYQFEADENVTVKLKGTKEKYFEGTTTVNTNVTEEEITADIMLEKRPNIVIVALVTDKKTGTPLEGVTISITDVMANTTETFVTGANGQYIKELPEKRMGDFLNYDIYLEKGGYLRKHSNYSKKIDRPGVYNLHETLDLNLTKVEVGVDIAKAINLNPIYFDVNKFDIRADAALELDRIVAIMNEFPNMVVELGSHTDCRSSKAYNMKLSDKRAKASAGYIKKSIKYTDRIFGRGYGESKLVNNCACEGKVESKCSEEEHAVNRRTEFIIIKMR